MTLFCHSLHLLSFCFVFMYPILAYSIPVCDVPTDSKPRAAHLTTARKGWSVTGCCRFVTDNRGLLYISVYCLWSTSLSTVSGLHLCLLSLVYISVNGLWSTSVYCLWSTSVPTVCLHLCLLFVSAVSGLHLCLLSVSAVSGLHLCLMTVSTVSGLIIITIMNT